MSVFDSFVNNIADSVKQHWNHVAQDFNQSTAVQNINQLGNRATGFGTDIKSGIDTGNWGAVGNDLSNLPVVKVDPATGNKTLVTGQIVDKNNQLTGHMDPHQTMAVGLSFGGDASYGPENITPGFNQIAERSPTEVKAARTGGTEPPIINESYTPENTTATTAVPIEHTAPSSLPEQPSIQSDDMPAGTQPYQRPVPKPGPFERGAMHINQIDQIQLPLSSTSVADEAYLKDFLNNGVKGNSLADKAKNLGPAFNKIEQQINSEFAKNDPLISTDSIRQSLDKRLQPLIANGTLTPTEAITERNAYLMRMHGQLTGNQGLPATPTSDMSAPLVPDAYKSSDVLKMKRIGNQAANSLYDSQGNLSSNLTKPQQVTLALRNGVDDAFAPLNSNIKNLLADQSAAYSLIDARGPASLNSLRNASRGFGITNPLMPTGKIGIPGFIGGPIRTGLSNALLSPVKSATVLGGIGTIGEIGREAFSHNVPQRLFNSIENKLGYQKTNAQTPQENSSNSQNSQNINDQAHTDLLPQSPDDVKPDKNGIYTPISPDQVPGSTIIGQNDYRTQRAAAVTQQANDAYKGPRVVAQDQAVIDNLDSRNAASQKIWGDAQNPAPGTYYNAIQTATIGKDATTAIKDHISDPELLNLLKTGDLLNATNPNYSKLKLELQFLEKQAGLPQGSLFKPQTTQVALQQIDQAIRMAQAAYNTSVKTFMTGGAGMPQSAVTSPAPAPTGLPAQPTLLNPTAPTSQGLPAMPKANFSTGWQPTGQSFEGGAP